MNYQLSPLVVCPDRLPRDGLSTFSNALVEAVMAIMITGGVAMFAVTSAVHQFSFRTMDHGILHGR